MVIKEGWDNFKNEVNSTNKPIICFGAGAISSFLENLFIEYGLWEKIIYFIDNDQWKEGKFIGTTVMIPVISVNSFRKKKIKDFIFLIAIESYVAIERQFEEYSEWANISSYVYVKINKEIQLKIKQPYEMLQIKGKEYIPRIIHYCWFGKGEKSELHKRCIESWKKYCPDYEIIEWNENNYNVAQNKYMQQAYEAKKWAYVSDYARIDILYNYGGVYLDTDVELVKSINLLLKFNAFIAHGQWPAVNSGAGLGSVKGNLLLEQMLDERKEICFKEEAGGLNMTQNGFYEMQVLRRHGLKKVFLMQCIDGMTILAPEIMATASVLGKDTFVTEKTLSIHHCEGSWNNKQTIKKERRH